MSEVPEIAADQIYGTVAGFAEFFSPDELQELELIDNPTESIAEGESFDRVIKNLISAASVINTVLPPRVQAKLPDLDVRVLEHIAYEIARYFLDKNLLRETVEKRYEQALALLEKLADDSKDGILGNDGGTGTPAGFTLTPVVSVRRSNYEKILGDV